MAVVRYLVADVDAAAFYVNVIGFELVERWAAVRDGKA